MADDISNVQVRNRLIDLPPGASIVLDVPAGEALRKFSVRVACQTHVIFGRGNYRTTTAGGKVEVTRVSKPSAQLAAKAKAVPQAAANDDQRAIAPLPATDDDKLLTRKQAVEFLAPWFPQGLSVEQLRAFCHTGRGPAGFKNGRYVLHRVGDLRSWIAERLQPLGPRT